MDLIEGKGPEAKLQQELIEFLERREWFVKSTHGNMYTSGWPDLWASHYTYGHRWVEVKCLPCYGFTAAQKITFPKLCTHGSGVWVLTNANEIEYKKLWQPPNWTQYLTLLKNC